MFRASVFKGLAIWIRHAAAAVMVSFSCEVGFPAGHKYGPSRACLPMFSNDQQTSTVGRLKAYLSQGGLGSIGKLARRIPSLASG